MNYPFDDDYMKYDYNTHIYYLTPKAAIDLIGENLDTRLNTYGDSNPSTMAERFCKKSARKLWRYVKAHTYEYSYIEYIVAKDGNLRKFVQDLLLSQLEYNLLNGFPDEESGMFNNSVAAISEIRNERAISPDNYNDVFGVFLPGYRFTMCTNTRLPAVHPSTYEKENY